MLSVAEAYTLRIGDIVRRLIGIVRPRKIVTIHHLACSGGTIMTKSLAAMNSTLVLSEIHPDRMIGREFHPLWQAVHGYGHILGDGHKRLVRGHFRREIQMVWCFAEALGRVLVIRDHSHPDFVWHETTRSRLFNELSREFSITPIVTMRDPREVWVSIKREGWLKGSVDELCRAHLNLLLAFPEAPLFFYEEFANSPNETIQALCESAHIPFEADFMDRIPSVRHMTGDSGRKGDVIAPRSPKALDPEDCAAFDGSPAHRELLEYLRNRLPTANRPSLADGNHWAS